MNIINKFQPAFASVGYGSDGQSYFQEGLTKREYIAAMAMQGLLAKYTLNTPSDQTTIAQLSVELADVLLNEMSK